MKSLSFIFKASIAGFLIAGIILFWMWPHRSTRDLEQLPALPSTPSLNEEPAAPASAYGNGPFSYAAAVDQATPSVVNIYTSRTVRESVNPLFERFFNLNAPQRSRKQTGLGSGVIFTDNGYIITNYHVVKSAEDIRVSLYDGRDFPARFIGADPETDIAILHIDMHDLNAIRLGDSNRLRVGDVVLAIGNPFGVGQTVTMGIVSATGRDHLGLNTFENFIQTDAAINPGNSGGALVNATGELVGINTAIFSQSGGSQGIGFAIPVDMAKTVLDQISRHGKVIRGWLGVEARDLPPSILQQLPAPGVLVAAIFQNGPADRAGLQRGDVITEINRTPTINTRTLLSVITDNSPGTELTIKVLRNNQPLELKARLMERPPLQS
ncbi:MAG TPA: trypsin-like peptidase domain-containing protein [Gammaproteobacteria bacterium]|nr:trypsin-like peptidase domain-containing protein [Gammaproteobacteria bacterium]